MPDSNDDHAAALIAALAPKLIEAILPKIAESVEVQIGGLKKKNEELLGKLAETKKPDPSETFDRLSATLDAQQKERAMQAAGFVKDAAGNWILGGSQSEPGVYLSREDARNIAKYQAAKLEAEKRGLPLRIGDSREDPTRRNTTAPPAIAPTKTISLDDDHHRIRYVRADHQTGNGIVHRRLEAERQGFKIQTWRTPEDLPQHMQTKLALMEKAHEADS
ncbi:MAG: hypothetical protein MUE52_05905 [Tabrizicola sp.]|jgi:hypothetical protein|nr:hypothetical protein [Tabrizicola sp.]